MTGGQWANGIGSAFTALSGLSFIVIYAVHARWWKSPAGRMMMMYAGAITATCTITLSLTLAGFKVDADWLRYIQAMLITSVGGVLIHQSVMVWKSQRKKGQ